MIEATPETAKIARAMVREYLDASGEKLSGEDYLAFFAQVRSLLEAGSGMEQLIAEMAHDHLTTTDEDLTRPGFLAFITSVLSSLRGAGAQPVATTEPEAVDTPERAARKRPTDVLTKPQMLDAVHANLIGAKPKMAFAVGLLKKPGKEYAQQRNALVEGPAVPPERSYNDAFIICLEDGDKTKYLKRHLKTKFGMTFAEYLDKWGLPASYPSMPAFAVRTRARLAKMQNEARDTAETA